MEQEFTTFENKAIGRNISRYRNALELKAFDVADQLEMKEQSYLKYERGETQITIDFVQKVADVFKVSPLMLLTATPGNIIENGNNSPIAINGENHTADEQQMGIIAKLIETQIAMNEKIMKLLEKK